MGCSCRKSSSNIKVNVKKNNASKVRRASEVLRTPVHERLRNSNNPKGYIQTGENK